METPFNLLYSVSDLPAPSVTLFSWLPPTTLDLAACVCRRWHETAAQVRKLRQKNPEPSNAIYWGSTLCDVGYLIKPGKVITCDTIVEELGPHAWILDIQRWLPECGFTYEGLAKNLCTVTARDGKLGALRWAQANGFQCDEGVCIMAAAGGHLKVLQWARSVGCPWNKIYCQRVAQETNHAVVAAWISNQQS